MTTAFDLDGPRYGPASGQAPKQLVVLLHGLGADGNDLISLAPYFAQVLPEAAFVSPHAPDPCDMNPMGRQWFDLSEMSMTKMLAGARAAAPAIDAFWHVWTVLPQFRRLVDDPAGGELRAAWASSPSSSHSHATVAGTPRARSPSP